LFTLSAILSIDDLTFFRRSSIFLTDSVVDVDNFRISFATILNPFPDSPTLAASIAAFNPNRFVCEEMPFTNSIIMSVSSVSLLVCFILFAISMFIFARLLTSKASELIASVICPAESDRCCDISSTLFFFARLFPTSMTLSALSSFPFTGMAYDLNGIPKISLGTVFIITFPVFIASLAAPPSGIA